MNVYVLDASVAAKWFLFTPDEPLLDKALELRNDLKEGHLDLLVPDLFWVEMGNIFWKAVRSGRMSKSWGDDAIRALSELDLPTAASKPLLKHAMSIATTYNRTVYDSIYVALAAASNRSLITADERLANALAASFPIRWLGALA